MHDIDESDLKNNLPFDAVVYWVDGSDELWQKKFNQFSPVKLDFNDEEFAIRYGSVNEIDIAIRSIIKFAPFLRNLFLVSDNQIPGNFDELKALAKKRSINLKIVDHKEIFRGFERYLPTFNSTSIETLLYRIPGLSEHFIVFNDDTFLINEIKRSDFFDGEKIVLRGKWEQFYEERKLRNYYYELRYKLFKKEIKPFGYKKNLQNAAKLIGFKNKYFYRAHVPFALKKSTLEAFFTSHSDKLEENIRHRFRSENQFIISSLMEHIEIKKKNFVKLSSAQLLYFGSYKPLIARLKLKMNEKNKDIIFMCCQNLIEAEKGIQSYFIDWLYKRIN